MFSYAMNGTRNRLDEQRFIITEFVWHLERLRAVHHHIRRKAAPDIEKRELFCA